ncbi:MAG: hypothetical protein M1817_000565 [Caeruleum heppii]|nr:MAG: hypothetical protein M1817_000565 [Caeruleum heppii]
MPSSDSQGVTSDAHPGHSPSPDDNPFVTFRRYADAQVAALLQSVTGLAPNPSRMTSDVNGYRSDGPAVETSDSSSGHSSPVPDRRRDHSASQRDPAIEDISSKHRSYTARNRDNDATRRRNLKTTCVQGDDDDLHQSPARTNLFDLLPVTTSVLAGQWPIGYLLLSPYSPLHLEQRAGSPRWQEAFEDLLLTSEGSDMQENQGSVREHRGFESGDWINRLFDIGLLGGWRQMDSFGGTEAEATDHHRGRIDFERGTTGDEDTTTELDMYEDYLHRHCPPAPSMSYRSPPVCNPQANDEASRRGIVSMLTTTERTTTPEGVTTTKTVLRKRFADGREESSETVHTAQVETCSSATSGGSDAQHVKSSPGLQDTMASPSGTKKSGWFWSA